jgi:hypothetical protein
MSESDWGNLMEERKRAPETFSTPNSKVTHESPPSDVILLQQDARRTFIGTLRAQLTGRRHYQTVGVLLGEQGMSLSRTNDAAKVNRKYDPNATVVINSKGQTLGSVGAKYAALVAPVIDNSLATLECIISYPQRNDSLEKQYHRGEQLDMDIRVFAESEKLSRLASLLPRLRMPDEGEECPSPAAKRARVDDDSCHTNLRSVAGGVFKCAVVHLRVGGGSEEKVVAEKIRYPDAWLKSNPQTFDGAKQVIMYREDGTAGGVEVFRCSSFAELEAATQSPLARAAQRLEFNAENELKNKS